ncbi:MAG: TIGR00730 family Rossman fold protein [Candidatus Moranbacteria bacterium]|nr:TIGR00730 family Rossman fold protein [Candidatus Moranbacteria bacterium]
MSNNKNNNQPIVTGGQLVNFRDSWKIFSMVAEMVEGLKFLKEIKKEVTILGSARLPSNNKYYKIAQELGYKLARAGFAVLTGGGPGIMEAGNKGAFEAGGESIGLNIQLPFEQRINPYVKKAIAFEYFYTRKVMLTAPANGFVFFPGGFGTMDEFFEVVDAMEMGQMQRSPIILVGKEFWQPVVDFVRQQSAKKIKAVKEEEISSWYIVETADEAFEILKNTEDVTSIESETTENPYLRGDINWRMFRIMAELVNSFDFLTDNVPMKSVTVLGTKEMKVKTKYYEDAYEVGKKLAQKKYITITGGGTGIMEAANKGAIENEGKSIGVFMKTKNKEMLNKFTNKTIGFSFPFVRKMTLMAASEVLVFFPGSLGTMHNLFEILTLLETNKITGVKIVLYGKDFWEPMREIINNLYLNFKTIGHNDRELINIIDSPEELEQYL